MSVTVTCKNEVRRVSIDPSLLSGDAEEDREMLEDLVMAAMNDALRKAEKTSQERMSGLTAGMQMPPGFKMPF